MYHRMQIIEPQDAVCYIECINIGYYFGLNSFLALFYNKCCLIIF